MIYSKFEAVPCCVFKDNILLKYNDKFKEEFDNVLDYLLKKIPDFIEIKDTLIIDKKTYTVYVLKESDTNLITYIFFDITELAKILDNKGVLEISDFGVSAIPKTNIKIIDKQHSEIIQLIEDVNTKYKENAPLEDVVFLLFEINGKTISHFKTEEGLIDRYNLIDEESIKHIEDHEKLLTQIKLIINQLNLNNIGTIINYLRCWFIDHVIEHDLLLGKLLFQKGVL